MGKRIFSSLKYLFFIFKVENFSLISRGWVKDLLCEGSEIVWKQKEFFNRLKIFESTFR
jgi:hypothetical protein